jgi:hypothetical protein
MVVEAVIDDLAVRANTADGLSVDVVVISASVSAESTLRCVDFKRSDEDCSRTAGAVASAVLIVLVSSLAGFDWP